jgi:hypothetical protein
LIPPRSKQGGFAPFGPARVGLYQRLLSCIL